MSTSYDIKLFNKILSTYPNSNMKYVPNIIKDKKSGPKQREINRNTKITGNCISDECKNQFDKSFRQVVDVGPYCIPCSKESANKKRRETCVRIHGVEYVSKSEKVKQKREETCTRIYGNKNAIASKTIRDKSIKTLQLKYDGAINPSQIPKVLETKKQNIIDKGELVYSLEFLKTLLQENDATLLDDTINELELVRESTIKFKCKCGVSNTKKYVCIRKYGAFCEVCQDINAKEKAIETNMNIRGVPHPSNDPTVMAKIKSTNMEIYGFEYATQSEKVKQRTRDTCQINWGVDAPMMSPIVQETARNNNLQKYKVRHPMQVPEIAERCSKSAYAFKDYEFPSGRKERIQGTENHAIDYLLSIGIHEDDILIKRTEVPEAWWVDAEGKEHRYYVDISVKSQNLCIESKSTWTAEKKKDTIFLKQNAVKDAGYRCEIWVFDSKGNKVECHI